MNCLRFSFDGNYLEAHVSLALPGVSSGEWAFSHVQYGEVGELIVLT